MPCWESRGQGGDVPPSQPGGGKRQKRRRITHGSSVLRRGKAIYVLEMAPSLIFGETIEKKKRRGRKISDVSRKNTQAEKKRHPALHFIPGTGGKKGFLRGGTQ